MRIFLAALLVAAAGAAHADCPSKVTDAIKKAFPDATVTKCKAEKEDGHDQFEAKLKKKDGSKLDVDLSPDGKILQTEEKVDVAKLPAAVTKAFATKYPKAKADKAEKQTRTATSSRSTRSSS